ncbi:MAG: glycosyl hydrolase [Armatimonadetes bacterium]|nr:glycosyl hydrolase [Armatimonadota bacterium]
MQKLFLWACLAILVMGAGDVVRASENRFWLANQSDFGAKRGFWLDFENSSAGDAPCTLRTLKLILGVADGTNWHFFASVPAWRYDHDYRVRAVFGTGRAQLWLDGQKITDEPSGWKPDTGALTAGQIPNWAHGAADYWIVPASVRLTPGQGRPLAFSFPALSAPLMLFEPQAPRRVEGWHLKAGTALTVEATFRLSRPPADPHSLTPLVDRYGQFRDGDWPGKTHADADLRRDRAEEDRRLQAWSGARAAYDRFGGWRKAGWHDNATGVFQTVRHNGVWWLLSPEGNPCFYTSVCTAPLADGDRTPVTGREYLFAGLPPRDGPYAAAWGSDPFAWSPNVQAVSFPTANLIRKYGGDWRNVFHTRTVQRLKAWGFSGFGKWCDIEADLPSLPVLNRGGVPTLAGHPDPFDPATAAKLHDVLAPQITPHRDDPTVVAWSLGNEHDEIITAGEIRDILGRGGDVPAKRALVDEALAARYGGDVGRLAAAWGVTATDRAGLYAAAPKPPDADVEALRQFYADHYYALIEQTVKSLDPKHLYAGFWIVPGWWENEQDWDLIARHCDVIGYDNYAFTFADDRLTRLMRRTDKPTFCGEFSFPPQYAGQRGFRVYDATWSTEDADAGRLYARYVADAARNPYCVGLAWFEYRDEPLTGRGGGHGPDLVYGEDYAFGTVDVADHPKWDLIAAMRRANLAAPGLRLRSK